MSNPYANISRGSFWRTGVAEASPSNLTSVYTKKWGIGAGAKIATAGSCFAQHISHNLRVRGFNVIDTEPPPYGLPKKLQGAFGYGMYSARFGNIYTVQQLLQLANEAILGWVPGDPVWKNSDGQYVDAFRPNIEPVGLKTVQEVQIHRKQHLKNVRTMLSEMDVLVFTFGLTEAWAHKKTGTVYPTAPGIVAGIFDSTEFEYKNFNYNEVIQSFKEFCTIVENFRGRRTFKIFITVSPVPLTATASGEHVLPATTYSKSVLRAVAGDLSNQFENIDYFPSYEIITNPGARSSFYDKNLRTVEQKGVKAVMKVFFSQHGENIDLQTNQLGAMPIKDKNAAISDEQQVENDIVCEDDLLEHLLE